MKMPDPNKMRRVKGPVFTREKLARTKVRITTHLDSDLLDALRRIAKESGGKYQTVINQALRHALLGEAEGLLMRVERLEREVFKKAAA